MAENSNTNQSSQTPTQVYQPQVTNSIGTEQGDKTPLLDQRWFVLAAIFLAMMFLGLPLLWRCPGFSRLEKFIWTLVTLAYSAALIWIFVKVMAWSWRNISNAIGA